MAYNDYRPYDSDMLYHKNILWAEMWQWPTREFYRCVFCGKFMSYRARHAVKALTGQDLTTLTH